MVINQSESNFIVAITIIIFIVTKKIVAYYFCCPDLLTVVTFKNSIVFASIELTIIITATKIKKITIK